MSQLGVCVLGTGWVAGEHIKAYQRNPRTKVVAILGRERASALAAIQKFGLDDCLPCEDLDQVLAHERVSLVSICTPSYLHAQQAIACALAGRHVLIEKPMALSLEDAQRVVDAVRKAGVRSLVGFVLRWSPLFKNIRALLEGGLLGEVHLAEVDYRSSIEPATPAQQWMLQRESAGTNLLMAGCHAVDALRWFVGSQVTEVVAYSGTGAANRLRFGYDPNSITLLRFANGAIGKVSCTLESPTPYEFSIRLMGDRGAIRDDSIFTRAWPGQLDWATIPTVTPDTSDVAHHPFPEEIDHLLDCILSGRESHCSAADALGTHEICFASDLSSREGRPIRLPIVSGQPPGFE